MNRSVFRGRLAVGVVVSLCAAAALPAGAQAQSAAQSAVSSPSGSPASAVWIGGDFKSRVASGYIGGVYALNGNLDTDGVVLRGQFSYAGWDFSAWNARNQSGHGNYYNGNASIGYQWVGPQIVVSTFAGLDYQDFDVTPSSALRGRLNDHVGLLLTGRVATRDGMPFSASLDGQYSTANNQYWTRLGVGINLGQFTMGPELIALGNESFGEIRVGGFAKFPLANNVAVQANVGYSANTWSSGAWNNKSGAYGGVSLVLLY